MPSSPPVKLLGPNTPCDRSWTGNDASAYNHNGIVGLTESPLTIELSWRSARGRPAKFVGCFRLDLQQLLAANFIRTEDRGTVRLRFFHAGDGGIYVQRNLKGPRLLLGRI